MTRAANAIRFDEEFDTKRLNRKIVTRGERHIPIFTVDIPLPLRV